MSIAAYRAWRIKDWQSGVLQSAFADADWAGPTFQMPAADVAKLPINDTIGIHALAALPDTVEYMEERSRHITARPQAGNTGWVVTVSFDNRTAPSPNRHMMVLGQVQMFGVVVEHEKGYRASHALIEKLWVSPVWDDGFSKRLADRYQCDVLPWDENWFPKPEPGTTRSYPLASGNFYWSAGPATVTINPTADETNAPAKRPMWRRLRERIADWIDPEDEDEEE